MTATLTSQFVLTDDEMLVVASRIGVQALPVVLSLRPRHGSESALAAAADRATRTLADRFLIDDGEVAPDLVRQMHALQRPDRELAMRLVTPDGIARLTVVRQGALTASALRVGNDITLETTDALPTLAAAVRMLMRHLPPSAAAEITAVGAPLEAAAQALSGPLDATLLADRIRSLGAESRAAITLGAALGSRLAFGEIVYYTLDGGEGRISRCPGAVGVFYTKRGRIVAAPSASPAGQLWTTVKSGSAHAIRQAIGQLVELSTDRWEES